MKLYKAYRPTNLQHKTPEIFYFLLVLILGG
jgi:hypothetical protein